jgi:hypothetical protein
MLRLRPGMPSLEIDDTTRFLMSESGCDIPFTSALQNSGRRRPLIPSSMDAILAHRFAFCIQKITVGGFFANSGW